MVSDSLSGLLPPDAVLVVVMEAVAMGVTSAVAALLDALLDADMMGVDRHLAAPAPAAVAVVAVGHGTRPYFRVKRLESRLASSNMSSWHHCVNSVTLISKLHSLDRHESRHCQSLLLDGRRFHHHLYYYYYYSGHHRTVAPDDSDDNVAVHRS